ncbi:PHO85 cyclin-5 [Podospora pseudocomata]|uniref:PHO85 cyclin-5 n=1 Tax=Podospora pseudocomata TaxID=2093779 RepID=A0ABR0GX60_9PEZI|nr:PHO85 cyclin-5 [Podospora pseudocomata]
MKLDTYLSPAFINPLTSLHNATYNQPLAALASASTTSIWSDASSQHSDDNTSNGPSSDSEFSESCFSIAPTSSQSSVSSFGSYCEPVIKSCDPWVRQQHEQYSRPESCAPLRQNPRRTSNSATSRTGRPPALVRQADRKVNFVDNLVDTSTHMVEAIWPTSSPACKEVGSSAVLPLRSFIQETLRRSRTSYSTLQVALYYLVLIRPHVPSHDFTMEQPDSNRECQALQCGRRMFLAALILASKYLQDRNYSARAWSRISGLKTSEINQNEMAFILAVNWNLHITEETYKKWSESVLKFTPQPPSPPSPSAQRVYEQQCEQFQRLILNLTPSLDNLEELAPWLRATREVSIQAICSSPESANPWGDLDAALKPRLAPVVMEPSPPSAYVPGRFAPALGLLPTPRTTPQTRGFSTPAVSAASHILGRSSSMGFAMAQASSTSVAQTLDRWPPAVTSSPMNHLPRRSSLANSVSTASSPESMVSDSSRLSRSSSISSLSSVNAPSAKLDAQARCRYGRSFSERMSLKPTIASVPEVYEEGHCLTASPESYTGPAGKDFYDGTLDAQYACRQREMNDAAMALQELQRQAVDSSSAPVRSGTKRSRTFSMDNAQLQESVRGYLSMDSTNAGAWPESMVRGSHKRVCCSTEAAQPYMISSLHPAVGGPGGPGMWQGILQ